MERLRKTRFLFSRTSDLFCNPLKASMCNAAHRSDHFTDEDGWGPPVTRGARDEPLAVKLQEKLGTGVNVNTCTMLPEKTQRQCLY